MANSIDKKSVVELGGAVRFDPILKTYIVRIPAAQFSDREEIILYLELSGKLEQLDYDAKRDIYFNNFLRANAVEEVEKSVVIIK